MRWTKETKYFGSSFHLYIHINTIDHEEKNEHNELIHNVASYKQFPLHMSMDSPNSIQVPKVTIETNMGDPQK